MKLIIVESPTKARKLSSYLGSGYEVMASVGHVRDLPKKELAVDVENNFQPKYVVSEGKTKVIRQLKSSTNKAEQVIIATDPDREGEAIGWHLVELLDGTVSGSSVNSNRKTQSAKKKTTQSKFVRASFHEITKSAVEEAITHPGQISMDLVDAQQARRVLDRLVGYKVSPVLWKKVRRGLSAGRVQSVAVRLIVEREREIEAFKPEEYWEVYVGLNLNESEATKLETKLFVEGKAIDNLPDGVVITRLVELNGKKYEPVKEAEVKPLTHLIESGDYQVKSVEKKERQRQSYPPLTTSTLQQAAANLYGYSSKQTMRLAQQLYEEGLITYHRTDSMNLSTQSIEMARSYIQQKFGSAYLPSKPRLFKSKAKNAQEAHEAIRVTEINLEPAQLLATGGRMTTQHQKVYEVIWRRFLASQMEAAVYDQTKLVIQVKSEAEQALLQANGSTLKFDGWMRLSNSQTDVILPSLSEGEKLYFQEKLYQQKFTQPPARYNDASLVKELEKRGIGRPSTYASIISVIIDRGYVERDAKRFVATAVGMTVTDFLLKHFTEFMEYDFTAEMEEDLDRISRGERVWYEVVRDFYGPFEKRVGKVTEEAERVQVPLEKTGEKCPDCDEGEIVIRAGRFGKFKSCSRFPECKFTQNIVETLPDQHCPLCGKGEVIVKASRWGKSFFGCSLYPQCDWASWSKPAKDLQVTPEEWAVMQEARAERKAAREAKYGKQGARGKRAGGKVKAKSKAKGKRKAKAKSKATKVKAKN